MHLSERRLVSVKREFDLLGLVIRVYLAYAWEFHQRPADGVLTGRSTDVVVGHFQYDDLGCHLLASLAEFLLNPVAWASSGRCGDNNTLSSRWNIK